MCSGPYGGCGRPPGGSAEGKLDTRLEVKGADELADLSQTFNDMAARLEESMAELRRLESNARRFAADVSHELRTPLAAMSAVTDVLDEDADSLDPDTASAVRLISQETGKLARMVEDLMEVSRFDAGAAALHLDEVDVAETIRKTLQARAWQKRVSADLPADVRARLDPRRLDVVVANLVGNALHHGGEPVRVRLHAPEPGADRLLIEISDSGPGIDPEVLPHVFDRFYKADSARARSEGSGLGLAIAQENVRLHGGTMRAANAPEGGAVFTVDLPLRHEEAGEPTADGTPARRTTTGGRGRPGSGPYRGRRPGRRGADRGRRPGRRTSPKPGRRTTHERHERPERLNALRATRARRRALTGRVLTAGLACVLTGTLAGVLAGCGIAPTDVIDAGEPATGVKSPGQPEADVQLFFYGPSGLRSATRRAKTPADPEQALQMLHEGTEPRGADARPVQCAADCSPAH